MMKGKTKLGSPLAIAVKSGKLPLPEGYVMPESHGHRDSFTTVRLATYRDRKIRVETTYKITINEEPVTTHTTVLDDGSVHCHSFPNYSFPSAMDLARKIVDVSGTKEPRNELGESGRARDGGHV